MKGHWAHGRPKMEKRTPNDADDPGPLGQHHQHHWGPVSPFAGLLGCLCPLGKHETSLACIAQAEAYKICMLHGCWARFAHISSTFVAPKLVQRACYWQLICPPKCICGLKHGQPAQRTMSNDQNDQKLKKSYQRQGRPLPLGLNYRHHLNTTASTKVVQPC